MGTSVRFGPRVLPGFLGSGVSGWRDFYGEGCWVRDFGLGCVVGIRCWDFAGVIGRWVFRLGFGLCLHLRHTILSCDSIPSARFHVSSVQAKLFGIPSLIKTKSINMKRMYSQTL